jgi:hypothetical protein
MLGNDDNASDVASAAATNSANATLEQKIDTMTKVAITQMISRLSTPPPPPASTSPTSIPYGMPSYDRIPPLSNPVAPPIPSPSITTTTAPLPSTSTNLPPLTSALLPPTSTMPMPIHQIPFPHSPSPILGFSEPHHTAYPPQQNPPNQHHHNLPFPAFPHSTAKRIMFVGCPAVRASSTINQGMLEVDKVWMATYYLTGAAQLWSVMLRRDEPTLHWPRFKTLCQQHFGPPLRMNTLGEVTRLPFRSTVEDYQDRFLALLCHTKPVPLPHQQAQLFTIGLPWHLQVDVELGTPDDLQQAMALAQAYECRPQCSDSRVPSSSTRILATPPSTLRSLAGPTAAASTLAAPTFKCLTPSKMME